MKKLLLFLFIVLLGSQAGQAQTYCTPTYYSSEGGDGAMSYFSVTGYAGTSISDGSLYSGGSTIYFNHTADTVSFQQGGTYPVNISYYFSTSNTGNQVYIDFNDDGVFDTATEAVSINFPAAPGELSYLSSVTGNIVLPVTATAGYHRMRIRNIWYVNAIFEPGDVPSTHIDPCYFGDASGNEYWSGISADYTVDVIALPPCGGAPVAGAVSGPSNICPSTMFTLGLTGDSTASGLVYQWYSRTPAGTGAFTAIAGATSNIYTSPGQFDTTDYKLIVTCTASGLTDSTAVFTINENPFYTCYCNSGLGGDGYDEPIDSVAIAGTTLNNYTPYSTSSYTSFPATGSTTCTLQQSLTYTMFVNSNGYDYYQANMWIDYDHSGTFDASEYTNIASYHPLGTSSNSFVVSATSLTGLTGMRVRTTSEYNTMGSTDACTYEYDGQTQDYMITIIPAIPCNGAPAPGTAFASATGVCAGAAFNLSDTGATFAGGIIGQWYSSPSGAATWSALYGGSSAFVTGVSQYVATDYIYVVTCSNSGISDTSNTQVAVVVLELYNPLGSICSMTPVPSCCKGLVSCTS